MLRLANSAGEPLIVRMAAVRGLGQVLPESPLMDALGPLLQDPQSQLRGVTAETLSHTAAGCAAANFKSRQRQKSYSTGSS